MIDRRHFLLGGVTTAAVSAAGCQFEWLKQRQSQYPNVLMLIIDDLNDWVGAFGGHPNAKTPNIDRLASQSTVFTNAHAPAPICGPSRASIMTGLAPSSTGIYGHIKDNDIKKANDKAAESIYLSEYFKRHGYHTAAVGKVFHQNIATNSFDVNGGRHEGFGPRQQDGRKWDHPRTNTDWGPLSEKTDEQMPDFEAAQWLTEQLRLEHDKPFFMAGGFLRPHTPWNVPKRWFDMHPLEHIQMPPYLRDDLDDVPEIAKKIAEHPMMPTTEWAIENGEWRNIVQSYLASVSFIDYCVGIVLDALESSIYANNTAVVLWGDHGYHIGEKDKFAKMTLWDRATRTPLIIMPSKSQIQRSEQQATHQPVSLLDLYPTLLKMCGLPPNTQNQGRDISALLSNPKLDLSHAAVTTFGPNNHAVKTERYRYIRYENGAEELYDHYADSNEWHNLASNPEFAALKVELRAFFPDVNANWSPLSYYTGNDYFKTLTDAASKN